MPKTEALIRILLVDDSVVIRKLLSKALSQVPSNQIVAMATNGIEAIHEASQHQPDIVILDIEMPHMDGLTALPQILKVAPKSRVIVVSRATQRNTQASLEALKLGASDYIPKPEIDNLDEFYRELLEKVQALSPHHGDWCLVGNSKPQGNLTLPAPPPTVSAKKHQAKVQALAIAASTGGPQALFHLFTDLRGCINHIPIFITQHMPATFTPVFVEHLSNACKIKCVEAQEGMQVSAGTVYLAPGDYHLTVTRMGSSVIIRTPQTAPVNFCRPSADPMFESLAKAYGSNLLALVMTGMGQDGMEGAKHVIKEGGGVVAQDAASCVVYGMPKAVIERGLCEKVIPLNQIGNYLINRCEA